MVLMEMIIAPRRSSQSMYLILVIMEDCKEWGDNGDCGDDHVEYGDHRRTCR